MIDLWHDVEVDDPPVGFDYEIACDGTPVEDVCEDPSCVCDHCDGCVSGMVCDECAAWPLSLSSGA